MKVAVIGVFGGYLDQGRRPRRRPRPDRAVAAGRARAARLRSPGVRPAGHHEVARRGRRDRAALALVRELTPQAQQADPRSRSSMGSRTDDHTGGWLDLGGISIKIGDPSLQPKDPAAARVVLPKIAAAARASGDAKVQARTLAIDRPPSRPAPATSPAPGDGPVDPRLEAVGLPRAERRLLRRRQAGRLRPRRGLARPRPATDRPPSSTLGEAEALARAIAAEDQKLIAQIVIAQKHVACGRRDAARRSSPRRSRSPSPSPSRGARGC